MKSRRHIFPWLALSFAVLCLGPMASAETASGRGGPFITFHAKPLAAFDAALGGNIMVVGGKGVGTIARNFRLGGAGGGGFAWGSGDNVSFGMGYGGMIAEYSMTPWMTASMLVGGGGFAVSRITSETITSTTYEKISAGGFVLFYPSLDFEVKIRPYVSLIGNLGYFLPTNTRLHSVTVGISVLMGKI